MALSERYRLLSGIALLSLLWSGLLPGLPLMGGHSAHADLAGPTATAVYTVCRAGPPACDYTTIQEAVDAAGTGDVIKVAAGVYSDTHARLAPLGYPHPPTSGFVTQTLYLTKTLAIRGGYTTTNGFADPPDPTAYPTTLDARGGGRVLLVAGAISPTVQGLRLTGGNAFGLSGDPVYHYDFGGGAYILFAAATFSGCVVFSNTAEFGGGVLLNQTPAVLAGNTIVGNTALGWWGGGLYLYASPATLRGNMIAANDADTGGGLYLEGGSAATLEGNTVVSNTASGGAGLYATGSTVTLCGNTFADNMAAGGSGGLALDFSEVMAVENLISGNSAPGGCGGVSAYRSDITFDENTIVSNTTRYDGGGLCLQDSAAALRNNLVVDNQAGERGGGVFVQCWYAPCTIVLAHNTITRNDGGDGSGIYVTNTGAGWKAAVTATVYLTNTILVSQSVGVYVATGNVAFLNGTLWGAGPWANGSDWAGAGTIVTGTVNFWGVPRFRDPDQGDYHLGPGSAAIDAGVDAGVVTDIDGQPRPIGRGYDLGADEFPAALALAKQVAPTAVPPGALLTYTLRLTNTGILSWTAVLSDILPSTVTPTGVLTWTELLPPGGVWAQTMVVTAALDYLGLLTNVVHVSTTAGVTGTSVCLARVEEPLSGLVAASDGPTPQGWPTTLTAAVTTGSDVVYTWALGDGASGSGAVVVHTYPNMGVYTAVVTASNDLGGLTATTVVTITEPIYLLYLPLLLHGVN